VRILSLVEHGEVPRFNHKEVDVEIKHIDIDDDPMVDILEHLQDACDWIQEGLELHPDSKEESQQVGVLVHCRQGISRSGSFIVAYCTFPGMRVLYVYFNVVAVICSPPTS
jgi:dual specificity phosphatase 12